MVQFRLIKSSLALSLKLILLAVVVALAQTPQRLLAKGIPQSWESREYQPPTDIGAPSRVGRAGTRGDTCPVAGKPLTALVPDSHFGVTVAGYPTFFVYMPAVEPGALPPPVEFLLEDANENTIYRTTFQTDGKSGILTLSLPPQAGLSPLNVGQDYKWSFSMICNADERGRDMGVDGWIRRVEFDPTLKAQVMQASPLGQVELYAEAEIWHDALASLVQLRRNNPGNSEIDQQWEKLLSAVGLSNLTQETVVSNHTSR